MSESKDARIREQLGAWWAEEFPTAVMPTEALIRLSERLAAIDDGRDRRLPDRQTVTDAFGVPFMQISTPAPSPSAEEEARGLAPCQCGVGVWLGTGRDPRAHASLCPTRLRDAITTVLAKRDADVAEWKRQCEAEGQVAYMERDRAEAAVAWAMCEERRRQAAEQSVTCWQADSAVWQARFSDAAARLETMRATVRDLLLSADALWEEHGAGHNWREACERARTALGVETENEERPSKP